MCEFVLFTLQFVTPKESSGGSLPNTDEFRAPGKIARRAHRERYKDAETAMVRPHRKDGRRKSSEESDGVKPNFRRARERPRSRYEERV